MARTWKSPGEPRSRLSQAPRPVPRAWRASPGAPGAFLGTSWRRRWGFCAIAGLGTGEPPMAPGGSRCAHSPAAASPPGGPPRSPGGLLAAVTPRGVAAWLRVRGPAAGPLLLPVDRHGRVLGRRLTEQTRCTTTSAPPPSALVVAAFSPPRGRRAVRRVRCPKGRKDPVDGRRGSPVGELARGWHRSAGGELPPGDRLAAAGETWWAAPARARHAADLLCGRAAARCGAREHRMLPRPRHSTA